MIWLLLAVLIVCIVVLLIIRGMKGPARTLNNLEKPIKDLLKRGYDGGFLIIDIAYSNRFIQLRKYIKKPDDYGIELSFPKAKWAIKYFDKLKEFCKQSDIPFIIVKDNINGPLEFLYIDFKKDYLKANIVMKKILVEIFDVNKNVTLFVRLENATTEDVLISK